MTNIKDYARVKRHFLIWFSLLLAAGTIINGLIYQQVRNQQGQTNDAVFAVEEAFERQFRQTLLGCQRGNELRRAVGQIAAEQASRTRKTGGDRPILDPEAFRIASCRATVIAINGIDPGPVGNFVE